jgi:iron complex transport system ATP-binding protein
MIEARTISVALAGRRILHDLSISVESGEMVAVLGPNGSGKSTLIRALAGLLKPVSGSVLLNGRDIHATQPREVARQLAVVGQSGGYIPSMTVERHVALGRHPHQTRWSMLAAQGADDKDAIEEAIKLCSIAGLRHRTVETLSGGERQRVRIAMALAQRPRLLILDEPFVGLDIEHQLELLSLLHRLNEELGLTMVVVLHDLDHALRHFERAVVVQGGRISADGPPESIFCGRLFSDVFKVDGCTSRDAVRQLPVVVCQRRIAASAILQPVVVRDHSSPSTSHAASRSASVSVS